ENSFGAYKYCLYQIVIMSLVSQQLSILGPVFCVPLHFPNILTTFDQHKSFFVYEYDMLKGSCTAAIDSLSNMWKISFFYINTQFSILFVHKSKMSTATRKMHIKFIVQLLLQASVPFVVIVCPALTLVLLLVIEIPLETNR
ncbi:hypothetical protein PMAYCL1PPCAC_31738, partial [Pristionchus mayeri]